MAKSLDAFVAGLCAIRDEDFTHERVADYLKQSPVEPDTLTHYLHWEPTHYTRNLIHKCELFELMAICWDVGQVSRIHNHAGQSCWMAVPIGRLVVQNYEVVRIDASTGHCQLREASRVEMNPGQPAAVDPRMPVHAVLNPPEFGARAASLHVYSKPYDRCLVYDLKQSSYCEVPLFYDTEFGQPAAASPANRG